MTEQNNTKTQGILFDLDGTLWDSSVQVVEAFNIVLAQQPDINRQITLQDMQSWMGLQMDEIGRRLLGVTMWTMRGFARLCAPARLMRSNICCSMVAVLIRV